MVFEAHVGDGDLDGIVLADGAPGRGVVEVEVRKILAQEKGFAPGDGEHHAHHLVETKNAVRQDHFDRGIDLIAHFRQEDADDDEEVETDVPIDPCDGLIDNLVDAEDFEDVAVFRGALPDERSLDGIVEMGLPGSVHVLGREKDRGANDFFPAGRHVFIRERPWSLKSICDV